MNPKVLAIAGVIIGLVAVVVAVFFLMKFSKFEEALKTAGYMNADGTLVKK